MVKLSSESRKIKGVSASFLSGVTGLEGSGFGLIICGFSDFRDLQGVGDTEGVCFFVVAVDGGGLSIVYVFFMLVIVF